MVELKTKKTEADPGDFLGKIKDAATRKDCADIAALLQRITGAAAKMWGPSIVGFGSYHYKYDSGREGDWFRIGVASNRNYVSLYICPSDATGYIPEHYKEALPKASIGRGCVRFKSLDDLDAAALRELIRAGGGKASQKPVVGR